MHDANEKMYVQELVLDQNALTSLDGPAALVRDAHTSAVHALLHSVIKSTARA